MFEQLLTGEAPGSASRIVEVGWALGQTEASMIWGDPEPYGRGLPRPASPKSVQACPAALDFDARHFVVRSPVDLHLRMGMNDQKQPALVNAAGIGSNVRPKALRQLVTLTNQAEWRHPERPMLQLATPYVFLADEPVHINQVAPYLHYADPAWPGLLVAGRFPIHIWPRPLMWAFEWYDTKRELLLKRNDPLFYVRFEALDPSRPIRLVEAELVPETQAYLASISGVTNYVNRTYALFARAQKRRPSRLLVPRSR